MLWSVIIVNETTQQQVTRTEIDNAAVLERLLALLREEPVDDLVDE